MAAHVASLCRISYFQLRQLRPVASSLSAEAAKSLVQAFISCLPDYCNAVFYGMSDTLFRRHAVYPECSGTSLGRSSATRPHFTGSEATSLVASPTPRRGQARRRPTGIQVAAGRNPAVPRGGMPAHCQRCRAPPSSIGQCQCLYHPRWYRPGMVQLHRSYVGVASMATILRWSPSKDGDQRCQAGSSTTATSPGSLTCSDVAGWKSSSHLHRRYRWRTDLQRPLRRRCQ